jgi:hypothetical protein
VYSTLYALPADVTSIHTFIDMRVYILTVYVIPGVKAITTYSFIFCCYCFLACTAWPSRSSRARICFSIWRVCL